MKKLSLLKRTNLPFLLTETNETHMETANKSVAQLKAELEQAEKIESQKEHNKKLADAQKWVGKCYSSHLFQRVPSPSKDITIRKVTSVEVS